MGVSHLEEYEFRTAASFWFGKKAGDSNRNRDAEPSDIRAERDMAEYTRDFWFNIHPQTVEQQRLETINRNIAVYRAEAQRLQSLINPGSAE